MSLHWNGQRREPFLTIMFHSLWEATSHESVYQQQLLRGKESRSGNRTVCHPLTSLTPYRWAKPAHAFITLLPAIVPLYSAVLVHSSSVLLLLLFCFVCFLLCFCLFFPSPWYNRTGWLGVKHQLTYLLVFFTELFTQSIWHVSRSMTPTFCLWFDSLCFTLNGHLKKKKVRRREFWR